MKTPTLILIPLLLASSALMAQQGPRPPRGQPGQNVPPPPGQNDKGNKPMPPPPNHPVPQILAALDLDHDMTISREELRKAPAALRKLDRNKDGELTVEEFGVPRPLPPKDGEGKGDRKGPPPPREGADGDAPDGPPPHRPQADGEGPKGPPPPHGEEGEDAPRPPKGDRKGPPQGDKPGRPMGPPPPIIGALDTNHDGNISADEIKNSSDALRTLDKNGDGQLTPEEFAPKPPLPPKDGEGDVPPGPPPADEAN